MRYGLAAFALTVHLFFGFSARAEEELKVVATIKPVHSLVSMVTEELKLPAPTLLMEGHADPHHFSLKPSQAKLLEEADMVFYANKEVETFLAKQIKEKRGHYFQLFFNKQPISNKQPIPKHYSHSWSNMHISAIALQQIFFFHRGTRLHGEEYVKAVETREIWKLPKSFLAKYEAQFLKHTKTLSPHVGKTVWFDQKVGFPLVEQFGITGQQFDQKTLKEKSKKAHCIAITHGRNAKMEKLAKVHGHKLVHLDLIGSDIPAGSEHYFTLMDRLVQQLSDCLT